MREFFCMMVIYCSRNAEFRKELKTQQIFTRFESTSFVAYDAIIIHCLFELIS